MDVDQATAAAELPRQAMVFSIHFRTFPPRARNALESNEKSVQKYLT
jgi:hypothetical protein